MHLIANGQIAVCADAFVVVHRKQVGDCTTGQRATAVYRDTNARKDKEAKDLKEYFLKSDSSRVRIRISVIRRLL